MKNCMSGRALRMPHTLQKLSFSWGSKRQNCMNWDICGFTEKWGRWVRWCCILCSKWRGIGTTGRVMRMAGTLGWWCQRSTLQDTLQNSGTGLGTWSYSCSSDSTFHWCSSNRDWRTQCKFGTHWEHRIQKGIDSNIGIGSKSRYFCMINNKSKSHSIRCILSHMMCIGESVCFRNTLRDSQWGMWMSEGIRQGRTYKLMKLTDIICRGTRNLSKCLNSKGQSTQSGKMISTESRKGIW